MRRQQGRHPKVLRRNQTLLDPGFRAESLPKFCGDRAVTCRES